MPTVPVSRRIPLVRFKIPVTPVFSRNRVFRKLESMPEWARFLGWKAKPSTETSLAQINVVRILAITRDDVFYSALVDTAANCGWQIGRAATVPEGLDLIRSATLPLVILDWDGSDQDWRGDLKHLCTASGHPCVLLASEVADDNLKNEVLRHHGYDVLPRSGDREQIVRLVQFAWFWTTRSRRLMETETQKGKA